MNTEQAVKSPSQVRVDASGDKIVCDPFEKIVRIDASGGHIVCDPLEENIRIDASGGKIMVGASAGNF